MPNVNTINFGGMSNADMQAQQLELMRRQKMADILREQSMTPLEGQTVSGRAVPITGLQSAAKIAQALMGNYAQQGLDKKQAELGEAGRQRSIDALKSLAPAGTFADPTAGAPLGTGLTEGAISDAPKVDQYTRDRWAKILAANSLDPQLGRDLLKNELTMTDEQRNLLAQGIDPRAFGAARLAKEQAGGVTNVTAGTSVFNPSLGQFVAAAPDFGAGTQGGFGPNGQPQMSRIQGAEIIPQMAGEKARQEAAGKAGFNTITVNTPNGPVLMTEEQAAQMAGGGRQPMQSNQTAPVHFNASNGVSINISGKTPQQIIQGAKASGDPQVMQAVGEWMQSGQQQAGIPLQSEEARAFGGSVAKGAGEDLLKSRDSAKAAASDLYGINESRKTIQSGAFLGAGADVKTNLAKTINGWLGTDIDANKVSNTEYLRSTLGQRMLDNAKKLGVNPTDADARRLDEIVGTIAKDPKALGLALDFQESMAKKAIQQHNSNVGQASKNGLKSPYDLTVELPSFGPANSQPNTPAAPRMRRYNPATGRIE